MANFSSRPQPNGAMAIMAGLFPGAKSALDVARASALSVSPTQRQSRDADFRPAIDRATRESDAAVRSVWRDFAGPNALPVSARDDQAIFEDLPNVRPKSIAAAVDAMRRRGTARVVDPEGRVGAPAFVAGTAPDGRNVPLDEGSIARLGGALAHIRGLDHPGAPWGGTTYGSRSGAPPPGESRGAILLNTAQSSIPGPGPSGVLAHEIGHVIHNVMGSHNAPLAGASPQAAGEFEAMSNLRGRESAPTRPQGGSLADYRYMLAPQEQFAEGIRQYLTDPNAFKSSYPEAAKFLRGVVNSDPQLRRLLMLSQGDAATRPA